MTSMNIKKKLAAMLSVCLLMTAAAPASFAEGTATPSEAQQEGSAPLVELITPQPKAEETPTPTPEPTATPTAEPTAEPITPPPAQSEVMLLSSGNEEKTVAAPSATWVITEDSIAVTVTGEAGLRMYVDATIGWDDEVYTGETVTFSGLEAGKSYGLEVDYYELQEGVSPYRKTIEVPAASGGTQTTPPSDTQTTPPASSGAEVLTPPPSADTQTTPPAEAITPPPVKTSAPEAVKQFGLAVFAQSGEITAEITGASEREVELALMLSGSVMSTQAIIGNGTVSFGKQGDGTYTVRAAYVTPADGIVAVEKSVEIKNTGSSGSAPAEKTPTVMQLGATVTHGDNWIDVKVTDADPWPLYVAVGNDYKTVNVGETARFEGLAAGEYGVEVDYVDPVSGVSPFRSSVSITKAPAGSIVFSAAGGENRIEVIVSDASTLPVTVTVKKDGNTVASKLIPGGVGKAVFESLAAGTYSVVVNYDPAQNGIAEREQSGVVVSDPAPVPVIKQIAFSAAGGAEKIDVTITDASNLPVTIKILKDGWEIAKKTISAGVGSESFTGLAAGTYSVVVNYDPAQSGVSAKEQSGVIVTAKTAGITITGVTAGENVLTVVGTAQPGADIALTTTPAASAAAIVRADANGAFSAQITLQAGTYTQVRAAYLSDNSIYAVKNGTFTVTAPASKPPLTVDPIASNALTVIAKTNPGVTVNLRVKAYNYGQTVVADGNGVLKYSLPQTYPKGTEVTFTVYYGTNNAQSYVQVVTVTKAKTYKLLKYGDTGDEVEEMTERLRDLGYMDDDVRRYSSAVRDAVKAFQQLNGLEPDGIAGQETLEALYSVGAIPYNATSGVYPTLSRGDKGLAAIYKLQRRLKDLGYYTIAVDGIYGSGTERAVRHFQRINGLPKTGVADNATQQLLYSSSAKPADSSSADDYKVLSRSSSFHPAVVPLQRRLKTLGYAVGSVDGYFGSRTYRAVREFQKRNGLTATGIADETMQRVLFSSAAIAASGSSSSSSSSGSASYRLLTWGSKGDDVKKLQKTLLAKGYTQVRVADGIYGEWTYNAVRAFQKDHGLSVDGIAGKNTQSALYGTNY